MPSSFLNAIPFHEEAIDADAAFFSAMLARNHTKNMQVTVVELWLAQKRSYGEHDSHHKRQLRSFSFLGALLLGLGSASSPNMGLGFRV